MLATYPAEVKRGKVALDPRVKVPDGTKVLVTVLADSDVTFWEGASSPSLAVVWGNEEDDVYAKLLEA